MTSSRSGLRCATRWSTPTPRASSTVTSSRQTSSSPSSPPTPAQLAKLTDFGVARVIGGDSLTLTGDVIGTLAYMAPEQAEGLEAGAGADLYSLALVLYEALTGINPVRSSTAAQRARRLGAHLPPLRRQRRDLPRELGQGIDMALRPRPRERGTLSELRRALTAAQETSATSRASSPVRGSVVRTPRIRLRDDVASAPEGRAPWARGRAGPPSRRLRGRSSSQSPAGQAPVLVGSAACCAGCGSRVRPGCRPSCWPPPRSRRPWPACWPAV